MLLFWWRLFFRRSRRFGRPSSSVPRRRPRFEALEDRALPSATLLPEAVFQPLGGPGVSGYTPQQIRKAYGLDTFSFNAGTVAGDGSGQTIAIVVAYDNPNLAADLAVFSQTFDLPGANLTKVGQNGGALPATDPTLGGRWASEAALDTQWAHAIAPGANLLVVEANSDSQSDLLAAVDFARRQPGVSVVSMSFGVAEFAGELQLDALFTTPAGQAGVTFVAASGDTGIPGQYPAFSPNVLAAGGTTLSLDSTGTYLGESGWSNSGGGLSAFEAQPAYQIGTVTGANGKRALPDVAFVADPATGVAVYDSFNAGGSIGPWTTLGGTSLSAPAWAGIVAIANQGRGLAGFASFDGPSGTLPKIYALPDSAFNDILTGNNGASAGPGFDLVTGRGTPKADAIYGLAGATTLVSGRTFEDLDGDGTDDDGTDPGINGITIELYRDANGTGTYEVGADTFVTRRVTATPTSGPHAGELGRYAFEHLVEGTYFVVEVMPTGMTKTTPRTPPNYVIVADGSEFPNRDFGNFRLGTFAGQVVEDLDGDGTVSPFDPGLAGVTVRLWLDGNGSGAFEANDDIFVATTVSSSTAGQVGNYVFADLGPGQYFVEPLPGTGVTLTTPVLPPYLSATTTSGGTATLPPIGVFVDVALSGHVFSDRNADGLGAGEPGRNGITLQLLRDVDGDLALGSADVLVASTVSATADGQAGRYRFDGVGPGTYFVREVVPDGATQTAPAAPGYYTHTAISGDAQDGLDFGNFQHATLRGQAYVDLDGSATSGPGLGGVTIELYADGDGNGVLIPGPDPFVGTATTAGDGRYEFTRLPPATYFLRELVPPGYTLTAPADPGIRTVAAEEGGEREGLDFGNFENIVVRGRVFLDADGDGSDNGGTDEGVGHGFVRLYRDANGNGTFEADVDLPADGLAVPTRSDGTYEIANVGPGVFFVRADAAPFLTLTSPAAPGVHVVRPRSGVDVDGRNFGFFEPVSVAGSVFLDTNGDGLMNDSVLGPGFSVTVEVFRESGGGEVLVYSTTVPSGAGLFLVPPVGPGRYVVRASAGTGHTQTAPAAPGVHRFTAVSGVGVTGLAFGFLGSAEESYVYTTYIDLLGRPPDSAGLTFWDAQLSRGLSRGAFVQSLLNTSEFQKREVNGLYRQYLGRDADTAGSAAVLAFLRAGGTLTQLRAFLAGSDEYFNRAGGSNVGYLQALYRDALQRPLDDGGRDYWLGVLASGATRLQVALAILSTRDALRLVVDGYYRTYLGRPGDEAGLEYFVTALQRGGRDEDVILNLVASAEYFQQV